MGEYGDNYYSSGFHGGSPSIHYHHSYSDWGELPVDYCNYSSSGFHGYPPSICYHQSRSVLRKPAVEYNCNYYSSGFLGYPPSIHYYQYHYYFPSLSSPFKFPRCIQIPHFITVPYNTIAYISNHTIPYYTIAYDNIPYHTHTIMGKGGGTLRLHSAVARVAFMNFFLLGTF